MNAKKYAVFFLITFSLFLATPSMISIIENTADISYFFDIAEEEKKGETETAENTLVLTYYPEDYNKMPGLSAASDRHYYTSDNYLEIILNKNSPPPEQA